MSNEPVVVGQVWKELDSRFDRFVRVIRIKNSGAVVIQNEDDGARHTTARRDRFNGKHGGYILWKDVPF